MTGVQTCALPICFPVTIAYNLDTSQYGGYNKGYWEGDFKIFAFDMESTIFAGWEEADWA